MFFFESTMKIHITLSTKLFINRYSKDRQYTVVNKAIYDQERFCEFILVLQIAKI